MPADTLLGLPRIHAARCSLAALRIEDAPAFQAMTDDPVITGAVAFLSGAFTLSDALALIGKQADGTDAFLGIWRSEFGQLMGAIGAHLHGADRVEIGYWIGAGFRGEGYAGEAAAALIPVLRTRFPHRRVIAECVPDNRASWRVLTKLGFLPTGSDGERAGRKLLVLSKP